MTDEQAFKILEAAPENLTTVDSASPHALVFYIRDPSTGQRLVDPAKHPPGPLAWFRRFPTIDAADQLRADILQAMKQMRGEPEQAWSDVARLSNCPNPYLLPKFKNLEMEIIPIPQKEPNLVSPPTPNSKPSREPRKGSSNRGLRPDTPKPGPANLNSPSRAAPIPSKRNSGKKAPSKTRRPKTD